jgi:hypothetical protein
MKNLITGSFSTTQDYKLIENSLLDSGVKNEDFTIYLNDNSDNYFVSVDVKNDAEKIAAQEIFTSYNVSNTYYFEGVSEKHTYQTLKELIGKVAKAEITHAKSINIKGGSEGMTDEVVFGK